MRLHFIKPGRLKIQFASDLHLEFAENVSFIKPRIQLQDANYTKRVISDFRRIRHGNDLLTCAEFNKEHEHCLDFIKSALLESQAKKKIVVTHHVPSFQMQNPEFDDSLASGAFIVELEDFIRNSDIDYWIYGHSHYNIDVQIGKTQCVSNQLGYVFHNEHVTFDPGKVIEV